MSKFKFEIGDSVRVINEKHKDFDDVGVIRELISSMSGRSYEVAFSDWHRPTIQEHHLTLADPDVHTVLDQMDAESALPQADLTPHLDQLINSGIWPLPEPDPVNRPAHYTSHPSGIECIEITRHMGFNTGNAFKYIWRADLKGNAIQDLEKAAFYIRDEIAKRKAAQ